MIDMVIKFCTIYSVYYKTQNAEFFRCFKCFGAVNSSLDQRHIMENINS